MNKDDFLKSLTEDIPDSNYTQLLAALWWDKKGNWDSAHSIAQEIRTAQGSAVHAYLHRKEGVIWNADYWYSRAGKVRPDIPLDEEWWQLVEEMSG